VWLLCLDSRAKEVDGRKTGRNNREERIGEEEALVEQKTKHLGTVLFSGTERA
jgi:hypothetical protein